MYFLYPSDPLKPYKPDEFYRAEVDAIHSAGFESSVFSLEDLLGGTFIPRPSLPAGAEIIYRGWMLNAGDYGSLVEGIRSNGASPLTDLEGYLQSHHLPNWYKAVKDLTPETRVFPKDCDLESELRALDWPEYFIKDYVKSLKTSVGSKISRPDQVSALIMEMTKYRGTIEGGYCVRKVEPLLAETERRYFAVESHPYAADSSEVPEIVRECARRIPGRFISIDAIQRNDGVQRIVEVGDGQVSDLVGWQPDRFAEILSAHFEGKAAA